MTDRVAERSRRTTRAAVAGLMALGVAALAACGGGGDRKGDRSDVKQGGWGAMVNVGGEPVRGGTLRIASQGDPLSISPYFFLRELPDQNTIKVIMQTHDRLVEQRPGSLEVQPGLAEEWEVSDDGLTYTFRLRDAEFSNGMAVTSSDVRYTLDVARHPRSFFVSLFSSISEIQTPDDSTVVIQLSEPVPALLYYLAFPGASIMPAKLVKSVGVEEYSKRPIGSGPFVLDRWDRDREVVLSRNENYWRKGLPYLDAVRLIATPDDQARRLAVTSGTVDVADSVPFAQIDTINKSGNAEVLVGLGAETYSIAINRGKSPYDDVAVRRALNYATPVDSIIDIAFHGHAQQANTELPKLKYWTDQAKAYPYDLEQARRELQQSSAPNGFTARLAIAANDQATRQIAQILQQSWAKIGIDLKIESSDGASIVEMITTCNYDLILDVAGGGSDVPVEDEFAQINYFPPEGVSCSEPDREGKELVRQATREMDEERRAELFEQLHVHNMENPSVVVLIYVPNRAAVANHVRDFNYLITGWFVLDTVWRERSDG